jgi:hypothetical protein
VGENEHKEVRAQVRVRTTDHRALMRLARACVLVRVGVGVRVCVCAYLKRSEHRHANKVTAAKL